MPVRIAVIGSNYEAMLAAWVFQQHPLVRVFQFGTVPRYRAKHLVLEHTEATGNLLRSLSVPHSSFGSRDALLIRGELVTHPSEQTKDRVKVLRRAYHKKAGGPPNAPIFEKRKRRLRCLMSDFHAALLRVLTDHPERYWSTTRDWNLREDMVVIGSRGVPYDYAVLTDPQWAIGRRVWFKVPMVNRVDRGLLSVRPREPVYQTWDRVALPYTPGGAVYLATPHGSEVLLEVRGRAHKDSALISDLSYLFPGGWEGLDAWFDHRAEISPNVVKRTPWMTDRVVPVGKYAEWSPKTTENIDAVLRRCYDLLRRWI